MAILVTGAGGLVGRAAVGALLQQGVEHVRAVVREPAQAGELRRLGAKVAVMDATDPDGMEAAMNGVFTACSLTGSLWTRPGEDPFAAVTGPARVFLAAAARAGVRRVVVCSPVAVGEAASASENGHLAAKAEVERMVAASGLEHAILRSTHVLGPGGRLLALLEGGEPLPGSGRQRVAPVWVGDVAKAIALADDAAELRAIWTLAGPEELGLDELVGALRAAGGHTDGHAGRPAADGLTPSQLGILAADSLPDPSLPPPPGLVPTPLAETLARSLAAV